jgi:hypothetical protein
MLGEGGEKPGFVSVDLVPKNVTAGSKGAFLLKVNPVTSEKNGKVLVSVGGCQAKEILIKAQPQSQN